MPLVSSESLLDMRPRMVAEEPDLWGAGASGRGPLDLEGGGAAGGGGPSLTPNLGHTPYPEVFSALQV